MSRTIEDVLAVAGNRPVFETLVSILEAGKAIAFVGAGASAPMYPLWGKFIELLADHAAAEGKAEDKDAKRWKADTASTPQQRVNVILRKLGEPLYRNFLRATFGPQKGPGGRRYTATHAALLRLPFRAYVTTNYDPALEFARAKLRPHSLSTGTPTWEDDDEVYRWRTGDVFKDLKDDCPMLWIHGYWQRPAGIVLNSGEYSQAYKTGLYHDTFKELWVRERLAFLGFGFNDPQFTFMVGQFLRDLGDANAVSRHVAILGLPVEKDWRFPDTEAIREWRENLEADYHVRPLFYPVPDADHSALQVLLEHLAERCRPAAFAPAAPPLAPAATPASDFPRKWVHETSNDEKFTGRDDEIARLDRWVRDTAVRVLAVCAVGGTGKTALIGHWLKKTPGWRSRPFAGLFAWLLSGARYKRISRSVPRMGTRDVPHARGEC